MAVHESLCNLQKEKRVLHPAESKPWKTLIDNDTPLVIEGPRLLKNAFYAPCI